MSTSVRTNHNKFSLSIHILLSHHAPYKSQSWIEIFEYQNNFRFSIYISKFERICVRVDSMYIAQNREEQNLRSCWICQYETLKDEFQCIVID